MPIKIADSLPARAVLESENIFVMTEHRALTQEHSRETDPLLTAQTKLVCAV